MLNNTQFGTITYQEECMLCRAAGLSSASEDGLLVYLLASYTKPGFANLY
jgi:hypothetical protein